MIARLYVFSSEILLLILLPCQTLIWFIDFILLLVGENILDSFLLHVIRRDSYFFGLTTYDNSPYSTVRTANGKNMT